MNSKNTPFTIYPAIDLRRGQVVRLVQGDPNRQTIYSAWPANVAWRWALAGAAWLHVVDLDAALNDAGVENLAAIGEILAVARSISPRVRVQLGGGLRSREQIATALNLGVSRVVLGTAAIQTPDLLVWALVNFGPDRVSVALDARAGQIQVQGWTQPGGVSASEMGERLRQTGLRLVFYTDIARDGSGAGVNVADTCHLAQRSGLAVVASGGVSSLEDVRRVRKAGLSGVIVGHALYEDQINLTEAFQC